MPFRKKLCVFALLIGAAFPSPAFADSFSHKEASFASGTGNILYLALGTALPLLEDGAQGKTHALRTLDAFGTSVIFSQLLKAVTREKRPDASTRDSFPSGHATAAFAIATMESHYHPRQAALWYGGAVLIGASRVQLHRHFTHDVLAGAALGYFTSRWEIQRRRGLILSPFIPASDSGMGLQLSCAF